jgi:maltose O-acetyltransferase
MAAFTGQKAKMLAGELYMASDPELASDHLRAQAILAKFNATAADADEERRLLLTQLLGRIGEGAVLKPTLRCDYGYNIVIGDRTFVNYDCVLLDCNRITIGDEVQIAPGVHIYTATHPVEGQVRRSGLEYALPVLIEDGVWLGAGLLLAPSSLSGPIRWWALAAWSREICRPTWWQSAVPVASSGSGNLRQMNSTEKSRNATNVGSQSTN